MHSVPLAHRSGYRRPAWVTGLAFVSANLGALEITCSTRSASHGLVQAVQGSKLGDAALHTWQNTGNSDNPLGANWIGAFPKLLIPIITVVPGLIALVTVQGLGADKGPLIYNNAIPLLMRDLLPNGVLGVAVTGLVASFMAGMAANVSGFNTVFTYDIWQAYLRKDRGDDYYLGSIAVGLALVLYIPFW